MLSSLLVKQIHCDIFSADKKVSELIFLKISKDTPQYYEILSDDIKFLLEELQAMLKTVN